MKFAKKDEKTTEQRKETKRRLESAKVDRYEAKTKNREKHGGAGFTVTVYDISFDEPKKTKKKKQTKKG